MDTDFTTDVCREAMIRIVENVFHNMLGADVAPGNSIWVEDSDDLRAFIDFVGAYRAELSLQCSSVEAKRLARLFMGTEGDDNDGESRDAMGELLNIIAGNLKPMLPKGTQTTLPSVVTGSDRGDPISETLYVKTPFSLDDGAFCLTFAQDDAHASLCEAGGWS